MLGDAFLVAAGLVHRRDAGAGAVLQVDRVVAGTGGGQHHDVRHALQQRRGAVELARQFLPRRADLIGMRARQHRFDLVLRAVVHQLVHLDVRPLAEDLQEDRRGDVVDVEHALDVGGHR